MFEILKYIGLLDRKVTINLLFNRFLPVFQQNLGNVKPGWDKLPPMSKKGSTFLNEQSI